MVTIDTIDDNGAKTNDAKKEASKHRHRTIRLVSMPDERGVSQTFELAADAASISEFLANNLDLEDDEEDDNDNDTDNDTDNDNDDNDNDEEEDATMEPVARTIQVPRVRGECLGRVVEFLEHYREEELKQISGKPLDGNTFDQVIDQQWYRDFMSDERLGIATEAPATAANDTATATATATGKPKAGETDKTRNQHPELPRPIGELFDAANFMGIERLLDLVVLRIAFGIVEGNKNREEIRAYLNLPEMTEEEEAMVRKDHPWIFEE